jgi:hypothetical protein
VSRTALAAVILVLLAGCGTKASRHNAVLLAENEALKEENEALTARVCELEAALAEAQTAPGDRAVSPEVVAATPHVAVVEIDRRSHARDDNEDGRLDELQVYVKPLDGRRRFIQLAGSLTVTATVVPPDAAPIVLARAELGPAELRDAYRSSFMGTHYRVVLPLPAEVPDGPAAVGVTYTDGHTGRTIDALREVDLRP